MGPNTSLPSTFFLKVRSGLALALTFLASLALFFDGGVGELLIQHVPGLQHLATLIDVILANGDSARSHLEAIERAVTFVVQLGLVLWVYAERMAPNLRLSWLPARWRRSPS